MKFKLVEGLEVRPSGIEGKGCFAVKVFTRRHKIAEYAGEIITDAEAVVRSRRRRHLRICAIDSHWSLDGSIGGNATAFINHSCEPNAFMRITHNHILFIARCDIQAESEITVDYGYTYHSDSKRCHCKAATCRGTINRPQD
ncbi:MAG: SET domain-containing protein-lysine N-methyltransferase [Pyrinomonadaceae bacterium MAG19_C2-C3]|nr:SET domain-containing protein-lysine N-methyltransferase [Pyrinomonadaceae bacterium MAG19_C2-C3]